ncbi:MAG TPA: hypothetical protein DCS28_01540 [Candidatus Moranbacteria bacterium]|nr:hypothetical protein [Candidatus Moranbacteria bacterium]HAT74708.1 hypothetical protein [Candidatus Moranbacteria bacterium]
MMDYDFNSLLPSGEGARRADEGRANDIQKNYFLYLFSFGIKFLPHLSRVRDILSRRERRILKNHSPSNNQTNHSSDKK